MNGFVETKKGNPQSSSDFFAFWQFQEVSEVYAQFAANTHTHTLIKSLNGGEFYYLLLLKNCYKRRVVEFSR